MTPDVEHETPESLWAAWLDAPGPVQPYDSPIARRIGFIDLARGRVHMITEQRLVGGGGQLDLFDRPKGGLPERFWELVYTPNGRVGLFRKEAPGPR